MNRSLCVVAGAALALACMAGSASAQCLSGWLAGPRISSNGFGTNGIVRAVKSWDPDGVGPAQPVLIVAGHFTSVGGSVPANNIAMWDGAAWWDLGGGVTGLEGTVYALEEYNGELVASGGFSTAGGASCRNIAKWNGASWSSLGTGLSAATAPTARAMAVFQGQLYVTGSFSSASNVSVAGIARWNGSAWSALPAGGSGDGNALVVYNNELYIGGNGTFNQPLTISKFDGVSWSNGPNGLSGITDPSLPVPFVRSMVVHDGKLVIGGNFSSAGPFPKANGIATWNGQANTWGVLGSGMDKAVLALTTVNGELYAGGSFTTAGGVLGFRLSKWNGSNWTSPSTVMSGSTAPFVTAMCAHRGELFVGGNFSAVNGLGMNNVVRYNGSEVMPVVQASTVNVMFGELAAGGDFKTVTFDGEIAENCVSSDGQYLYPFSDLGGFAGPSGPVYAMASYALNPLTPGYTVFGGSFGAAGGLAASNIATWRGSQWGTLGAGFNGAVRALVMHKGSLYAAGDFTASGSTVCQHIAKFSGGAWQPVAGGFDGDVNALIVFNGQLYAGGEFLNSAGVPITHLAVLSGGAWQAAGNRLLVYGLDSGVRCLATYNSPTGPRLAVGGQFLVNPTGDRNFATIGIGESVYTGYGTSINGIVRAAAAYEGDLVFGGDFTQAPSGSANRIARFDPDTGTFSALGQGVDAPVYSLRAAWGSELHVGGAFTTAGGVVSPSWARWNPSGRPAILSHPVGRTALGCEARMSVEPIGTYTGLQYQWKRGGEPLVEGAQASGAVVSGATGTTLTITGVSVVEQGEYTCDVSNACGTTVSDPATLRVCAADVNCDGFVDAIDYDDFIGHWLAGETGSDYNRDGFSDAIDYDEFVGAFLSGC